MTEDLLFLNSDDCFCPEIFFQKYEFFMIFGLLSHLNDYAKQNEEIICKDMFTDLRQFTKHLSQRLTFRFTILNDKN